MRVLIPVLLAGALANGAAAQIPPEPRPAAGQLPVVTNPDWARRPSGKDLMDVLTAGLPKGVNPRGSARIRCIVTVEGKLRECEVVSESPPGSGYGALALKLAPFYQMKPQTIDGKPVEAAITIPLNLDCESCFPTSGRSLVSSLDWRQVPTYRDFVVAYPTHARENNITGSASLQCEVTKAGSLGKCSVMSESPKGEGFGQAARGLAEHFQGSNITHVGSSGIVTRQTFLFDSSMISGQTAPALRVPNWTSGPTYEQLLAAFPREALKADLPKGRATASCTIGAGGALGDCSVVSEEPTGKGFGAAVLSLTPLFKAATWTDEGSPVVGRRVSLPVLFDLDATTFSKLKAAP